MFRTETRVQVNTGILMKAFAVLLLMALLAACAPAAPSAPAAPAGEAAAPAAEQATGEVNWLQEPDASKLPDGTTIRYWYYETPERIELGKQQVAEFEKMYPNIKIEGSTAPDSVDNEMLVAFIKAGNNSHVHQSVNMEDTWYFSRDLLLPVQDLPGFQEVMDRMNPNLNYTWKNGDVYSISWYSGPRIMYYNGARVREAGLDPTNPPQTYSQFLEWAAALTDDTHWFSDFWSQEEWWRWQFISYPFYIAATGTNQLVSPDGKTASFNTPEALQSYELLDTLFAKGYNLTETLEGDPFFSGQVAAHTAGADFLGNVKRNAPEGFELIVGPIPKPDDSKVEGFPTYNFVRNFAILREQSLQGAEADAVNRAAWEFMKFLLSQEQMAIDFSITGDFPPVKDLTTNPAFADILASLSGGAEVAQYAEDSYIYDMNTTLGSEIMGLLTKSYVDMIFDAKTPQEALDTAEVEVNKLLASQ